MTPTNTSALHHGRHSVPRPRRVPAKNCFQWLLAGWHMFAAQPATWIMMTLGAFVVLALISYLFGSLYIIGPTFSPIMMSPLLGGMLYAAREYHQSGSTRFLRLFEGFRSRLGSFLLVGFIFCSLFVLIALILIFALEGNAAPAILGTTISSLLNSVLESVATALVTLGVLSIAWGLMLLSLLFSPSLIVKDNAAPVDAFTSSLHGCFINVRAVVLLVIVLYALFGIVFITFGFGIFIYIPVLVGTLHAACQDIFPNRAAEPA